MSSTPCADTFELCVNEGSERDYLATLKDKAGVVIPLANLTDITLTLKDYQTGAVINSRNAVSVKNAAGGDYHATSGVFTMTFSPLDNVIVTSTIKTERHIATFLATFSGGGQLQWDVIVKVKNLGMVS